MAGVVIDGKGGLDDKAETGAGMPGHMNREQRTIAPAGCMHTSGLHSGDHVVITDDLKVPSAVELLTSHASSTEADCTAPAVDGPDSDFKPDSATALQQETTMVDETGEPTNAVLPGIKEMSHVVVPPYMLELATPEVQELNLAVFRVVPTQPPTLHRPEIKACEPDILMPSIYAEADPICVLVNGLSVIPRREVSFRSRCQRRRLETGIEQPIAAPKPVAKYVQSTDDANDTGANYC